MHRFGFTPLQHRDKQRNIQQFDLAVHVEFGGWIVAAVCNRVDKRRNIKQINEAISVDITQNKIWFEITYDEPRLLLLATFVADSTAAKA